MKRPDANIDLAAIRARLEGARGQEYWRSLEELGGTWEFQDMVHREFPPGASEWVDDLSRRSFLRLGAASLAMAGLTACTKQPVHEILPYVRQPEELVPGEPLSYATSVMMGGYATGVLVKSREGHPIKIEGNPEHPATLGGSDVWMQASILDLYDPDRSSAVLHEGEISAWALYLASLNKLLAAQAVKEGVGLRFLTGTVTSPTLAGQLHGLLRKFPKAKWHQYEPINRDNVREGARMAFGEILEPQYRFDKAAVILSLDSDFLFSHPGHLRFTRQFANGRRVASGQNSMNRLYVVESSSTITGSMAEHRWSMRSSEIEGFADRLAQQLGLKGEEYSGTEPHGNWLTRAAGDLQQHGGESIVIAGEWQPPRVHALAHWMNENLGNTGRTVFYTESAEAVPVNQIDSIRQLAKEIEAGEVEGLFILGGNPAYTFPADLEFGRLLSKVLQSIYLGPGINETATLCTWHIPETHYLESWGDARAIDGTVSIIQPLIAPLYKSKTAHELLGAITQQQPVRSDYEIVREHWRDQNAWPDFESEWRRALHDGFIAGSESRPKEVQVNAEKLKSTQAAKSNASDIEVNFRPDPSLWDGRFANNGWLQECPRPISKLTWDNAVLVSPALAQRHRLSTEDVVELEFEGRRLRAPVWVMPGQAENSITLHLGYGRRHVGRVGKGVGFNAYALRTSNLLWFGGRLQIVRTTSRHHLAATQTHHRLEGEDRQIYREGILTEYLARPDFVRESIEAPPKEETLYEANEFKYTGYKWGMSIDLTTCIGCNACLVACEVENNIPVVGKEQIRRNREMFWIRVDTYFKGSLDNPQFSHMPVPCMHCEHAPCELVCPVAATAHDHEGLNLQVYNRCVGTRYCSNNCPYKVRRFNFLQYADYSTSSLKPMYNPEVTVRWRGVMEKCTYCIQRISHARITAEKENRRIRDGEVVTACQQACPAEAIVFGDLNDPASKVAKLKQQSLDYPMLGQLNTRPRTTYLAKLRNPNPEVKGA
jgi:molybdopterin-containing oxidoreductase family iron-sulfur binding subunit